MDKFRSKVRFLGGAAFQKPITMKGNSASTQFFGVTAIVSGAAMTPVLTTIVKSTDWISVTPTVVGTYTVQTSGVLLMVSSVHEGVGFQIHFANLGFYGGGNLKACWEIRRVG